MTGPTGMTGKSCGLYVFTTSESVSNNDFIGSGNSSSNILRNTIIIPNNCIINVVAFTIRRFANNTSYTIKLYVNGIITSVNAIIVDGSTSYSVLNNVNYQLNALDIVTMQITFNNGALSDGACATLLVTSN